MLYNSGAVGSPGADGPVGERGSQGHDGFPGSPGEKGELGTAPKQFFYLWFIYLTSFSHLQLQGFSCFIPQFLRWISSCEYLTIEANFNIVRDA